MSACGSAGSIARAIATLLRPLPRRAASGAARPRACCRRGSRRLRGACASISAITAVGDVQRLVGQQHAVLVEDRLRAVAVHQHHQDRRDLSVELSAPLVKFLRQRVARSSWSRRACDHPGVEGVRELAELLGRQRRRAARSAAAPPPRRRLSSARASVAQRVALALLLGEQRLAGLRAGQEALLVDEEEPARAPAASCAAAARGRRRSAGDAGRASASARRRAAPWLRTGSGREKRNRSRTS